MSTLPKNNKPLTLTKAELVSALVARKLLGRLEAKSFVDYFFESIKITLKSGEEVKLSGFGNFKLRDKKARPGRNPKTGQQAIIQARRVVVFHVGEKLKALIGELPVRDDS